MKYNPHQDPALYFTTFSGVRFTSLFILVICIFKKLHATEKEKAHWESGVVVSV